MTGESRERVPIHVVRRSSGALDESICPSCSSSAYFTQHGGPVLSSPEVILVYWDPNFTPGSPYVEAMNDFVSELMGSFANRVGEQYQVQPGRLVGEGVVIDLNTYPAPERLSFNQLFDQVVTWMNDGVVPAPRINELQRNYLVFLPTTTALSEGVRGYHSAGKYNNESASWDTFIGVVSGATYTFEGTHVADPGTTFLNSDGVTNDPSSTPSLIAAHELAEMWTNPDTEGGWWALCNSVQCEIADMCYTQAGIKLDRSQGHAPMIYGNSYSECISPYALNVALRVVDGWGSANTITVALDVTDRDTGQPVVADVRITNERTGRTQTGKSDQTYTVGRVCTVTHGSNPHLVCLCDSVGSVNMVPPKGTPGRSYPQFESIPFSELNTGTTSDVPELLREQFYRALTSDWTPPSGD